MGLYSMQKQLSITTWVHFQFVMYMQRWILFINVNSLQNLLSRPILVRQYHKL